MDAGELKPETRQFLDSIYTVDDHGFQIRQHLHWLPESPADELERLEMNLLFYREFLRNGSRFPREIVAQREAEYHRIQELKRLVA